MGDEGITCAECGEPVDPDLSYIMSVPVGQDPLYHHLACIGLDQETADAAESFGG